MRGASESGGEKRSVKRSTRLLGSVSRGVGRYVCVGNYYIITQISRWVHSLQCRYPVLWPRAKGDSGPGRCLEMVRRVPIRLIHVYYEVTFYRRGLRRESVLQDCAQKLHSKLPVPWSRLPALHSWGPTRLQFVRCPFFSSPFSPPTAAVLRDHRRIRAPNGNYLMPSFLPSPSINLPCRVSFFDIPCERKRAIFTLFWMTERRH